MSQELVFETFRARKIVPIDVAKSDVYRQFIFLSSLFVCCCAYDQCMKNYEILFVI
jgi:hypothetical protein